MKTAIKFLKEKISTSKVYIQFNDEEEISKWLDEYADQFRQPVVSGNKAIQSENKKESEVALPLSFLKWWSGVQVDDKILRAYERWKKESGNER